MDTPLLLLIAGIAFVGLCLGVMLAVVLLRRTTQLQIQTLQEQLSTLQLALDEQSNARTQLAIQLDEARGLVVVCEREAAVVKERLLMQSDALSKTQDTLTALEQKNSELNDALARKESAFSHLQTSTGEQIALLSDAKKQLTDQFEQLANRIFDEKSQRFQVHSRDALEVQLKPFREQLTEFRGRVDHIYDNENR